MMKSRSLGSAALTRLGGTGSVRHTAYFDGLLALRGNCMRGLACKQLVKYGAQRIDIAGGSLSRTADLLRTSECGRQNSLLGERLIQRGIEDFGDAEIEELQFAGTFNQDVRRLEVAMNDELAVCVGNRLADFQEECQLATEIELGGVDIDGQAFDVFHRQIWLAVAGVTHVQKARDARMAEGRQNLALPKEAIDEGRFMAAVSDKS